MLLNIPILTLPLILSLTQPTTASPPIATLTQYLTSTTCSSSSSTTNITTTISLNQCLDTGSQENFASIGFSNLQETSDKECYGQVYEYAGCGTSAGDPTAGSYWRQGPVAVGDGSVDGGEVCFGRLMWADGQEGLGSVMLVCE